jgi:hypothetical protein
MSHEKGKTIPGRFEALVKGTDLDTVTKGADEIDYDIVECRDVVEPMWFGNVGELVAILRYPDGWVVVYPDLPPDHPTQHGLFFTRD